MVAAYIAKMMKKWEDDADVILHHITLGTSTFNHLLQYTLAAIHIEKNTYLILQKSLDRFCTATQDWKSPCL